MFCLPPQLSEIFKGKLKSGELNPEKLAEMTSEERRAAFSFLGEETAKQTNALFESKILLKNQQQGMINWAKQLVGLRPEVRRDIISRIEKMTEILTPKNEQIFLEDLVAHKLGTTVTLQEAAQITELSKLVSEKRAAMESGGERMEYGRAKVSLQNYINDLKAGVKKPFTVGGVATEIAGTAKSLKASMDNSAIFRQGWKTLWTNPSIWWENALKSFSDIWKTFGKDKVMDELNADIVSRPTYDLMRKAKLAVGTIEEAFPSQLPEKVPVLGKIYEASQNAYTAFVYRMRADVFDKMIDIARRSDIDLTNPKQLQSIGNMVNSLTGRGNLGKLEVGADVINNVFFSPRFLKSQFDFLTAHQLQKGVTPFVRKQAAVNLLKVISGTAAILAVARAINPDSVETDPRSADFGKIRVGDTRFDVTGGMSSLITLASRLLTHSTKSSITDKVSELNTGKFGSQTGADVIYNFIENKFSPATRVFWDVAIAGEDFKGDKPTLASTLKSLFVPIPFENYEELRDNKNSANTVLAMIADALGISTNTYSKK